MDSQLGSVNGVYRTRVGFGGPAEVVQVDFDPRVLSYRQLVEHVFTLQNPCARNSRGIYARTIMYHGPTQKSEAQAAIKQESAQRGKQVTTFLEPVQFRLAPPSDQKYYLRHSGLPYQEMRRHYPAEEGLLNSTAAAKINGCLGGNGKLRDPENLGLSRAALSRLAR